jgi:hypothetical protein
MELEKHIASVELPAPMSRYELRQGAHYAVATRHEKIHEVDELITLEARAALRDGGWVVNGRMYSQADGDLSANLNATFHGRTFASAQDALESCIPSLERAFGEHCETREQQLEEASLASVDD